VGKLKVVHIMFFRHWKCESGAWKCAK